MQIGDNYKIESDTLNVTVYEKEMSKKGEINWKAKSYHPNLKSALKSLVDKDVQETGLKDLKTVVAKQEELYHLIETLIPI